jgi:hypothetical protein
MPMLALFFFCFFRISAPRSGPKRSQKMGDFFWKFGQIQQKAGQNQILGR